MKKTFLQPTELIAMIDYPPLHSPEALAAYYKKFKASIKVEPVIVVAAKATVAYFKTKKVRYNTYEKKLNKFLAEHPSAKYFMSGGKHRSAAATILGIKIPCLVAKNDNDVAYINALMATGKITGVPSVGANFEKTLQILEKHFFKHKRFWTMDEKTKAMIKNKDIPKKMLGT